MAVKPIAAGAENGLLLEEWIAGRKEAVKAGTGDQAAYIYMRAMGTGDLTRFLLELERDAVPRRGLILDLRFNNGGNVHDRVLEALMKPVYAKWRKRGLAETAAVDVRVRRQARRRDHQRDDPERRRDDDQRVQDPQARAGRRQHDLRLADLHHERRADERRVFPSAFLGLLHARREGPGDERRRRARHRGRATISATPSQGQDPQLDRAVAELKKLMKK